MFLTAIYLDQQDFNFLTKWYVLSSLFPPYPP